MLGSISPCYVIEFNDEAIWSWNCGDIFDCWFNFFYSCRWFRYSIFFLFLWFYFDFVNWVLYFKKSTILKYNLHTINAPMLIVQVNEFWQMYLPTIKIGNIAITKKIPLRLFPVHPQLHLWSQAAMYLLSVTVD